MLDYFPPGHSPSSSSRTEIKESFLTPSDDSRDTQGGYATSSFQRPGLVQSTPVHGTLVVTAGNSVGLDGENSVDWGSFSTPGSGNDDTQDGHVEDDSPGTTLVRSSEAHDTSAVTFQKSVGFSGPNRPDSRVRLWITPRHRFPSNVNTSQEDQPLSSEPFGPQPRYEIVVSSTCQGQCARELFGIGDVFPAGESTVHNHASNSTAAGSSKSVVRTNHLPVGLELPPQKQARTRQANSRRNSNTGSRPCRGSDKQHGPNRANYMRSTSTPNALPLSRRLSNGTTSTKNGKNVGGRTGRLEKKKRIKAEQIRKGDGQCFRCFKLKGGCSQRPKRCDGSLRPDPYDPSLGPDPCGPCLNKDPFKVTQWMGNCHWRTPLAGIVAVFLPEPLVAHYRHENLESWLAEALVLEHGSGPHFEVQLTWGIGQPLVVWVEEVTLSESFGEASTWHLDEQNSSHKEVREASVPLKILGDSLDSIPELFELHMNQLLRESLDEVPKLLYENVGVSEFQRDLLKLIFDFYQTPFGQTRESLTDAIKMLILTLFMGQTLHLTKESRKASGRELWTWAAQTPNKYPTPRIGQRQFKQRVYPLLKSAIETALNGIHDLLYHSDKTTWTTAFAMLVLLGFVCEDLQDSIMLKACSEANEGSDYPTYYEKPRENIKILEELGFGIPLDFFNQAYRQAKFNPLGGIFSESAKEGLDEDSIVFIEEVRALLRSEESQIPHDLAIQDIAPEEFCQKNRLRLVKKIFEQPYARMSPYSVPSQPISIGSQ